MTPAPSPQARDAASPSRLVGRAFSLVGAAVLLGGLAWSASTFAYLQRAATVEGTVVGLVGPKAKKPMLAPVIEYRTDGATHQLTGVMSNIYVPPVGATVTVLYNRDNPADARMDSLVATYLFPLALALLGLTLLGVGLVTLKRSAPAARESALPAAA